MTGASTYLIQNLRLHRGRFLRTTWCKQAGGGVRVEELQTWTQKAASVSTLTDFDSGFSLQRRVIEVQDQALQEV